jgi:hypothetical protein
MEYKTASGGSWANCSAPETYYVRVKQAGSNFTGINSAQITVTPPTGIGSVTIQYWTDDTATLAANTGAALWYEVLGFGTRRRCITLA